MNNTKKYQGALMQAIETADAITPSVLTLAQVAKIKPEVLAQALADNDSVSEYRSAVATALQPIFIARQKEIEAEMKASNN